VIERSWFFALLLFATGAPAQTVKLRYDPSEYPKPKEGYRQPVAIRALIGQGNGGQQSHHDRANRYAWDYDVAVGTAVVAARAGLVCRVRQDSNIGGAHARFADESNSVAIHHLDGTQTVYLHLQRNSVHVHFGEWVIPGELIARSGDTGWAGRPHLHYSVVSTATQASVPSKFIDFERNGGVPKRGDFVPAALSPGVAQEKIDRYRRVLRRAQAASRANRPAIAWLSLHEFPSESRFEGYLLEKMRRVREEKFRKQLLRALAASVKPGSPLPRCHGLLIALEGTKDSELAGLRDQLARFERAQTGTEAEDWRRSQDAARSWVAGLHARFDGNRAAARRHFLQAHRAIGAAREQAVRELSKERMFWTASLEARINRAMEEARLVSRAQSQRILDDLRAYMKEAKQLQEFSAKAFPDDADKAKRQHRNFAAACDIAVQLMQKKPAR